MRPFSPDNGPDELVRRTLCVAGRSASLPTHSMLRFLSVLPGGAMRRSRGFLLILECSRAGPAEIVQPRDLAVIAALLPEQGDVAQHGPAPILASRGIRPDGMPSRTSCSRRNVSSSATSRSRCFCGRAQPMTPDAEQATHRRRSARLNPLQHETYGSEHTIPRLQFAFELLLAFARQRLELRVPPEIRGLPLRRNQP